MLSSPRAQPFGLLSNKAEAPFTLNGEAWKTVSQYVFINMFKNESQRQEMSEHVNVDPFFKMQRIKTNGDENLYNASILRGLRARFAQQPQLRARLFATRGSELVFDDSNILALLNNIRSDVNVVFDPLRGVEVPRSQVIAVVDGVARELLRNPHLSDDLVFTDLVKYASTNPQEIPSSDKIFININNIVPILKHRMRKQIMDNDVSRFKQHLLDVYLDYLLETEYPNLTPSQYTLAKEQQIAKEPRVHVFENQLFSLYEHGDIDHLILKRLRFTPDKTLEIQTKKEKEMEDLLTTPEQSDVTKVFIKHDDPFLPHFLEQVTMEGITFDSVVHYAYHKLFQTVQLPGAPVVNVNLIPLDRLQLDYNREKQKWIYETLKRNNEHATFAKLDQNKTLLQLLKLTGNMTIVWNDKIDPVLGIGDGHGDNLSGAFLSHLRDTVSFSATTGSLPTVMSANAWSRNWLFDKAQDLNNTMKLLETPTPDDLVVIYAAPNPDAFLNSVPAEADIVTLKRAGLNALQIKTAFPIIASVYSRMRAKQENVVVKEFVDEFKKLSKKPSKETFDKAESFLKTVFSRVTPSVKEDVFVASILANKETKQLKEAKWQRVNLFAQK